MQNEKFIHLSELKDKVRTLIAVTDRLKEENEQLFQDKQILISQNKLKEEKIKDLLKEIENLKLASALASPETEGNTEAKHNAKIKINKMVREIDKCISLLNKLN